MSYLFSDEFNGPAGSSPDPAKWWATPWCSTSPDDTEGCYKPGNCFQDGNSHLMLRVSQGTMGRPYDFARVQTFVEGGWPPPKVLAKITPPFHIEASIKMPTGLGTWASFWPMGITSTKPIEIDVVERRGLYPNRVETHLHNTQEWALTPAYHDANDLSAGFHVYAVEFQQTRKRKKAVFFIDGTQFASVGLAAASWQPVGIRLSNTVGPPSRWGGEGGPPSVSVIPADMLVDYVRAWRIA